MTLSRKIAQLIVNKNVAIEDVITELRSYNLLSLLPSIKEAVAKLASSDHARESIQIESPFEMSPQSVAHIKRIVGNDLAPHEIIINKDLLAGFRARFKGMLYDGSAQRIIKQLTN